MYITISQNLLLGHNRIFRVTIGARIGARRSRGGGYSEQEEDERAGRQSSVQTHIH